MIKQSSDTLHQTITIINLSDTKLQGDYISYELLQSITQTIEKWWKVLLFFNRRGEYRSISCPDCSNRLLCPYCNIPLSYHSFPSKKCICHQCNYIEPFHPTCKKCGSNTMIFSWVGIQKIEEILVRHFPWKSILRVDSDALIHDSQLLSSIDSSDIILGTTLATSLIHKDIQLVASLLFESEFSIPEYTIEEDVYIRANFYIRQGIPFFIQTFIPSHPLLDMILNGNYKEYMKYLMNERKSFWYPPFWELLYIWVKDSKKEKVQDIIYKLANKLDILQNEHNFSLFFSYDKDIWDRYMDEWRQKIIIKWPDAEKMLTFFHSEIIKNRNVFLERK